MASYSHNTSDLTPEMTSNTAPSPNVASAISERSGYDAYKAFTHACALNSDNWTALQTQVTGWLKFDFGAGNATIVDGYTVSVVTTGGYTNACPKNWTLEGSNNDSDWDVLDTQINQTTWADLEMRTFSFSNSTGYRYYRLNISANNGDSNWLIIGELELTYQETPTISADISPTIGISGSLLNGLSGDTRATLVVLPQVSGTLEYIPQPEINCPITISPSISGTISAGDTGTASVILPELGLSATGLITIEGVSNHVIPFFVLEAEGFDECTGNTSIELPELTLSATVSINEIGQASLTFPFLTLSASGSVMTIGRGAITIPRLSLGAETFIGEIGNVSVTIPALSIEGIGAEGALGTGAITLPFLILSNTGMLSAEGEADLTIPAFMMFAEVGTSTYLNLVMNLRNRALTLYENYSFNSLCRFNGVNLGATATKIYDLSTGITDNGTAISWAFKLPYIDLEFKIKKKLRLAWITLKTDGDLLLTVSYPDGTEHEYTVTGYETTEDGIRVKFGKGIKSRYVALEIEDVNGSTLELDAIRLQFDQYTAKR